MLVLFCLSFTFSWIFLSLFPLYYCHFFSLEHIAPTLSFLSLLAFAFLLIQYFFSETIHTISFISFFKKIFCCSATSFLKCFKSCFCFSYTVLVISKFLFIEFEIPGVSFNILCGKCVFPQCFYVHGGLWFIFSFYLIVSFWNSFFFLI